MLYVADWVTGDYLDGVPLPWWAWLLVVVFILFVIYKYSRWERGKD